LVVVHWNSFRLFHSSVIISVVFLRWTELLSVHWVIIHIIIVVSIVGISRVELIRLELVISIVRRRSLLGIRICHVCWLLIDRLLRSVELISIFLMVESFVVVVTRPILMREFV